MEGKIVMAQTLVNQQSVKQEDSKLLRMLDRGIDDMEAGSELPIEEAFKRISELRKSRRDARV